MPPLQRVDPVPADANSASRHASRRGLASEGGSRRPDEASFEGHAFSPRIKRSAKRSYSERPSSTPGLARKADSDRATATALRPHQRDGNRNSRSPRFDEFLTMQDSIFSLQYLETFYILLILLNIETEGRKPVFAVSCKSKTPNSFIQLDMQKCVGLRPLGAPQLPEPFGSS